VVEDTLGRLLDICRRHQAAINLAVIPGSLTNDGARFLREHVSSHPELVEVHQHGWMHVNHEPQGKKCEFGQARCFAEQREDIAAGKARMDEAFGNAWFRAFTPPWNRCTEETRRALEELGFSVLSTDGYVRRTPDYRFQQIPITLDVFRWKGNRTLRPAEEIVGELIVQMERRQTVGILLHHKVMDSVAFHFLDWLLAEIRRYPLARFHTFHGMTATLAVAGDRFE
jgi:peptidoglycan/xylan/chitin deacetylase (PgdA/CDA1 family)